MAPPRSMLTDPSGAGSTTLFSGVEKSVAQFGKAIDSALQPMRKMGETISNIIAGSGIGDASKALIGQFQNIAGAVTPFVEAFDPSTVIAFQMAFRDLQASIGIGLAPVLKTITQYFRMLASVLLPIMEQLQPVFEQLGEVFLTLSDQYLTVFQTAIEAIIPILETVVGLFNALTPVIKGTIAIFTGLLQGVTSLITGLLGTDSTDYMADLGNAMQSLTAMVLKAAASLAKFIGWTSFIDGVIKSLDGNKGSRKSAEGIASARNAQFSGIGDTGKKIATAAFIASSAGGTQPKKQEDYLKELVDDLKDIKGGKQNMVDDLVKKLNEKAQDWIRDLANELKGRATKAITTVGSAVISAPYNTAKAIGNTIADAIGL